MPYWQKTKVLENVLRNIGVTSACSYIGSAWQISRINCLLSFSKLIVFECFIQLSAALFIHMANYSIILHVLFFSHILHLNSHANQIQSWRWAAAWICLINSVSLITYIKQLLVTPSLVIFPRPPLHAAIRGGVCLVLKILINFFFKFHCRQYDLKTFHVLSHTFSLLFKSIPAIYRFDTFQKKLRLCPCGLNCLFKDEWNLLERCCLVDRNICVLFTFNVGITKFKTVNDLCQW